MQEKILEEVQLGPIYFLLAHHMGMNLWEWKIKIIAKLVKSNAWTFPTMYLSQLAKGGNSWQTVACLNVF